VLSYTIKPLIKRLNFAEEEDLKRHEVALWEHVTTRVLDQVEEWIEDFDSRSGLDPSEIALLDFTRKEYRYRQSRYRDYLNPDTGKEPANQPADDKTSDEHLHVMDFMGSRMMLRLIEMHRDVLIHTDWPDVIPDEVIRKAMKLTDIQLHWLSISLWSSYETSTRTPLITQWRP
jgi:hypothetical protein